jgi:signal transduction histidine kinase
MDKLFDPFFTTKGEGVGLGLVNTKSVVERHGGEIKLENAADKGARVIICLPVDKAGETPSLDRDQS